MNLRQQTCGRRPWAAGAAVVLLTLAGCGTNHPYPVRGQLLYEDGQPIKELDGFTVSFSSQELAKGARGNLDAEGRFQLTTQRPDDGAFPGKYKVIVTQPHINVERRETHPPVVDLEYEDPAKTPLEATVESKDNDFTFKLKRHHHH
jgi:hypothetical protein